MKEVRVISRVDFDALEAPTISQVRSTNEPGPCFKWSGPHFQKKWVKNKGHSNTSPRTRKTNNSHKFHQNNCNSSTFTAGTLSFQASHQIKPGNDISLSVNTVKHFLSRKGEKYTLQKKLNTSSDAPNSQDVMVNEVMETITTTNVKKQTQQSQQTKQLMEKIYRASSISTLTWCLPTQTDYSNILMLSLMKLPQKELVQVLHSCKTMPNNSTVWHRCQCVS